MPDVGSGGVRVGTRPDDTPVKMAPPEPAMNADTEFTGELLRQVREARGIELEDICNRTKIHIGHLRSIENEKFDLLPAKVYVRGFLVEYAKALRLDPQQVTRSYLKRYDAVVRPDE